MALSVAHEVTAIDINPVQLDYARARLAGAPAVTGTAEGVMGLGRGAMALFGWRRPVLERFLELDDVAAQSEAWRTQLDTRGFRLATDLLLSISGLKAVYASPFLAILPAHFGRVMRTRLARCFATFANRTNSYAHALLLGELPQPAAFEPGENLEQDPARKAVERPGFQCLQPGRFRRDDVLRHGSCLSAMGWRFGGWVKKGAPFSFSRAACQ
jgi:hypothetical protein